MKKIYRNGDGKAFLTAKKSGLYKRSRGSVNNESHSLAYSITNGKSMQKSIEFKIEDYTDELHNTTEELEESIEMIKAPVRMIASQKIEPIKITDSKDSRGTASVLLDTITFAPEKPSLLFSSALPEPTSLFSRAPRLTSPQTKLPLSLSTLNSIPTPSLTPPAPKIINLPSKKTLVYTPPYLRFSSSLISPLSPLTLSASLPGWLYLPLPELRAPYQFELRGYLAYLFRGLSLRSLSFPLHRGGKLVFTYKNEVFECFPGVAKRVSNSSGVERAAAVEWGVTEEQLRLAPSPLPQTELFVREEQGFCLEIAEPTAGVVQREEGVEVR